MTKMSGKKLKPWVEKRMWEVLELTVAKTKSGQEVHDLLQDLLTATERLMAAKRLSIAILLLKGYDYRQIAHVLKVFTSTILSVFKQIGISGRGFQQAKERIESDRQRLDFFKSLEKEIWQVFAGSRSIKSRVEADYRKGKFFRDSQVL